jgi:hypothetical protein
MEALKRIWTVARSANSADGGDEFDFEAKAWMVPAEKMKGEPEPKPQNPLCAVVELAPQSGR